MFAKNKIKKPFYLVKLIILLNILSFSFFIMIIDHPNLLGIILKLSKKYKYNKIEGDLKIVNIDSRIKLLRMITNNNIFEYKGPENCLLNDPDSQLCFYHLIYPRKVIGKKRILLGPKADGSYVILDDFLNVKIAYSFGISNMIQFDYELAIRGIDVYMYDHSINSLPYNHPKFHWKKLGICGNKEKNEQLKTLEELMIENGHLSEENMILKIDVEHWEWEALNDLKDEILNQFKYILIEFHFTNLETEEQLYYNVLKKLNKSHQVFYFRCHIRENIVQYKNNRICMYLELSYIIKKGNYFQKDDSIYPIYDFDYIGPNEDKKKEINYNFLHLFDFND